MFEFLKKLVSPFSRMKSALGGKIRSLFSKGADERSFDDLEKLFYEADLGAHLSNQLVEQVRAFARKNKDAGPDEIVSFVKEQLLSLFPVYSHPTPSHSPHVILVVGVNGSGKTTSLAKLAQYYRSQNKNVLIAAGDTFRAAAIEQLEIWADRIGVEIVKAQPKSDPAAVAFDATAAALARKSDILLIDTAGRLQNKLDLMNELSKIRRVIQKQIPSAPHETLLVLDATMGQNALDQARTFHQFTPITGIILTKLDGTAKGGIAASLQKELKIPVLWAGLGEGSGDLISFDPQNYVNALFQ